MNEHNKDEIVMHEVVAMKEYFNFLIISMIIKVGKLSNRILITNIITAENICNLLAGIPIEILYPIMNAHRTMIMIPNQAIYSELNWASSVII